MVGRRQALKALVSADTVLFAAIAATTIYAGTTILERTTLEGKSLTDWTRKEKYDKALGILTTVATGILTLALADVMNPFQNDSDLPFLHVSVEFLLAIFGLLIGLLTLRLVLDSLFGPYRE